MNVALFIEIKNEYTEHLVDTISPLSVKDLFPFTKMHAKWLNKPMLKIRL